VKDLKDREDQPILDQDDVEASWEKVKLHIETAANEALGKRRINKNSNKHNNVKPT